MGLNRDVEKIETKNKILNQQNADGQAADFETLIVNYGEDLAGLVKIYCDEHGIEPGDLPDPTPKRAAQKGGDIPKKEKIPSREVTLSMVESGMSPGAVAKERSLVLSTIQGHLCEYIETGRVKIDILVDEETRAAIEKALEPGRSMGQVKHALGPEVSYAQIKAVLAHQKYLASLEDASP